jgi:hypothetical protein
MKVYEELAVQLVRMTLSMERGDTENKLDAMSCINRLEKNKLPSGSGFDSGVTVIDHDKDRILLSAPFHKMDEHGCYDGWEEYELEVTPSLMPPGINIKVLCGDDCDGLRDYVEEVILDALTSEV